MAADRLFRGSAEPLSPELVTQRGFSTAFRGYEPGEVREFLGQVAESIRVLRERLAQVETARSEAEERAAHPQLDDETLMAAVGEETATILRTARNAAVEIRSKAEEDASHVLEDARSRAEAVRSEADAEGERRRAEAQAEAERVTERAAQEAHQTREAAQAEADSVRQQAEQDRRLTVEAAQAIREKILTDLAKRRKVATVQIEQLRAGRERLLDAYLVVRRTLDEVTDELQRADSEARAAAEAVGRAAAERDSVVDPGPVDLPALGEEQPEPAEDGATQAVNIAGLLEVPDELDSPEPPATSAGTSPGGAAGGEPELAVDQDGSGALGGSGGSGGETAAVADPSSLGEQVEVSEVTVMEESTALERVRVLRSPNVVVTPRNSRARSVPGRAGGAERNRPGVARHTGRPPAPAPAPLDQPAPPAPAGGDTVAEQPAPLTAAAQPAPPIRAGVDQREVPAPDDDPGVVEGGPASVEQLFARIRADQAGALVGGQAEVAETEPDAVGSEVAVGEAGAPEMTAAEGDRAGAPAEDAEDEDDEGLIVRSDEEELLLQRRDEGILEVESGLARRLKRALQDEQNDLLDRLRHVQGTPSAENVLTGVDAEQERFASSARPFLERAARAGTTFGRRLDDPDAPEARSAKGVAVVDIASDLAKAIVEPLRRRLEQAFEHAEGEDTAVLGDALSSAYREWKTQRIEAIAGDHVTVAFSRAAYLAVPEGTRLRWVVDDVIGFCPDCDDNVLAGSVPKGEPYPTGQLHPPAHAGCRCVLAPGRD